MVREGPKITATGENVPTSKTARATPSEPCCFAPGTLVATETGERPIETIEVGERVWTRLEDGSGEAFLAPVTATHIRHDRPILRLSVEQVQTDKTGDSTQPTTEDLLVTPGHPFYVAGQGFVSVEDLQQGDELVSLGSGKTLRVKSLVLEAPQGTTHNLTVDVGHTFFVGNLGTWVHNVGPCNTCSGGVCGGSVTSSHAAVTVNGPMRGPDGRFLANEGAPSVFNRKTEYPSAYRAGVRDEVLDAHTIKSGKKAGMILTEDGAVVSRNSPEITLEHKTSVVQHWNEIGHKSTRGVRNDFYNDTENLSVRLRSANSSDGGRMSSQGIRYRQDTGDGYSR